MNSNHSPKGTSKEMLQNGVPSNYHFAKTDRIDALYPLEIPFHLNEDTTKIQSAIFNYDFTKVSDTTGELADDFKGPGNFLRICIDGKEVIKTGYIRGSVDLTQYLITYGWHEIKIYSTSYVSMDWQLDIKSFVS